MPATLVLLRHGQSTWNLSNRFTGWHDVGLSELGVAEARESGRLMLEAGLRPDIVHTSLLLRAIQTANLALEAMGRSWLPVRRSWRLNERHYGALEGLNKRETADRYGPEQVGIWRRSYDVPPPPLDAEDERHPRFDPRYHSLPSDALPASESLRDVLARMLPWWYDGIVPDLRTGCVLVAAHGNSLRALVKHLEGLSAEAVVEFNIPTGVPRVYELDDDARPLSCNLLGDPAEIAARAEAVARQASSSPA